MARCRRTEVPAGGLAVCGRRLCRKARCTERQTNATEGNKMETIYYVVDSIDGDYAHLKRIDIASADDKLVAMALLPEGIREGDRLKYEMFQYEMM